MSVLVDRITAELRAHGDGPFINADCTGAACECGWDGGEDGEWATHVAERVAEALQLVEEPGWVRTTRGITEHAIVGWAAVESKPAEEKP